MPDNYRCTEEIDEDEDITQITEKVFLSGARGTNAIERMAKLGITHILTMGLDGPSIHHPEAFAYLSIRKEDLIYEDLLSSFPQALRFIDTSTKCLVHCHKGVSRSPTIVAAWLMKSEGYSRDSALSIIRERRPIVNPNWGFRRQLRLYEAMGCSVSGPLYQWYLLEVAGSQTLHPDTFTSRPNTSVDPASYLPPADLQVDLVPGSDTQPAAESVAYGCKECGRVLCTPVHVLAKTEGGVVVELIHWMPQGITDKAPLCCPAGHEVGTLSVNDATLDLRRLSPMPSLASVLPDPSTCKA